MVGCWGDVGLVVGVPGRAAAVKLLEVAVGPMPPGPLQKTQGACGGHFVRREGPVQSTRAWDSCGSWGGAALSPMPARTHRGVTVKV